MEKGKIMSWCYSNRKERKRNANANASVLFIALVIKIGDFGLATTISLRPNPQHSQELKNLGTATNRSVSIVN